MALVLKTMVADRLVRAGVRSPHYPPYSEEYKMEEYRNEEEVRTDEGAGGAFWAMVGALLSLTVGLGAILSVMAYL